MCESKEREEYVMRKLPAGVRKRKTGLLEKRFSVNGNRYSVYGRTMRQLNEKEARKRKHIMAEGFVRKEDMTTDQYFATWIEGKKLSVKSSTIQLYTSYYRSYASPVIGDVLLSEITRRQIMQMQCEAAKRLCPVTNNLLLQVIRIILNEAVVDKLLSENPASGVKPVNGQGTVLYPVLFCFLFPQSITCNLSICLLEYTKNTIFLLSFTISIFLSSFLEILIR